MASTEVNVGNIQKLIDIVRTKEHVRRNDRFDLVDDGVTIDGFNMGNFRFSCGTPSCLAGWSEYLQAEEDKILGKKRKWAFLEENASEYLGLSDQEGHTLFFPRITSEMIGEPVRIRDSEGKFREVEIDFLSFDDITPEEAIVTLEKLIETGKVDWSHCKHHSTQQILNQI